MSLFSFLGKIAPNDPLVNGGKKKKKKSSKKFNAAQKKVVAKIKRKAFKAGQRSKSRR